MLGSHVGYKEIMDAQMLRMRIKWCPQEKIGQLQYGGHHGSRVGDRREVHTRPKDDQVGQLVLLQTSLERSLIKAAVLGAKKGSLVINPVCKACG